MSYDDEAAMQEQRKILDQLTRKRKITGNAKQKKPRHDTHMLLSFTRRLTETLFMSPQLLTS